LNTRINPKCYMRKKNSIWQGIRRSAHTTDNGYSCSLTGKRFLTIFAKEAISSN
jgi:hypothetical protein